MDMEVALPLKLLSLFILLALLPPHVLLTLPLLFSMLTLRNVGLVEWMEGI